MKSSRQTVFTVEHALYSLALLLAFCLRFLNLGEPALSDFEANWALQALSLAQGQAASPGSQPFYTLFTAVIFALLKDTNAAARLLPALLGSGLVLLPLLFRVHQDTSTGLRTAGLIFAFGIAFDPALVYLSRIAGSPLIALACILLAAGFFWSERPQWMGVFAGLALLSGSGWLQGLLGLGIGLVGLLALHAMHLLDLNRWRSAFPASSTDKTFWRTFLIFTAGTVLFGGLLWLRVPQGISSITAAFPEYLAGWLQPAATPALRLPAAILLYQPLTLILGLVGGIHLWRDEYVGQLVRLFVVWSLAALLAGMSYPARSTADAAWALAPLWGLAALELSTHSLQRVEKPFRLPALGLGGLLTLFLVLIWYNMLRLSNLQAQPVLYAAILGGLVVMTLIVILLVGLGWSPMTARLGIVWGFSLVLGAYMFSGMWGMAQVRPSSPIELWTISPTPVQARELVETVAELSQWELGLSNALDITVTQASPSLIWALRGFSRVEEVNVLAYDALPSILVTGALQENPALLDSYRGQPFAWEQSAPFETILPSNWLRWLTYREMPVVRQNIVLWARSDLFPGEENPESELPLVP